MGNIFLVFETYKIERRLILRAFLTYLLQCQAEQYCNIIKNTFYPVATVG